MPQLDRHIFVCINERPCDSARGCCHSKGAAQVQSALKAAVAARGLAGRVRANKSGCLDQCEHGVVVVVYPEQVWYGGVTVDDVPELVDRHLVRGEYVERLLLPDQPHLGKVDSGTPPRR